MLCKNMYNDYDNCIFDYYTTSTFDNRIYKYLLSRYQPEAKWNYKATVDLSLEITLEDISELTKNNFKLHFYNDKYEKLDIEPVYELNKTDKEIVIHIDYNTSLNYFPRGTYHCSLDYVTYTNDEKQEIDSFKNLIDMNDYLIYVD